MGKANQITNYHPLLYPIYWYCLYGLEATKHFASKWHTDYND